MENDQLDVVEPTSLYPDAVRGAMDSIVRQNENEAVRMNMARKVAAAQLLRQTDYRQLDDAGRTALFRSCASEFAEMRVMEPQEFFNKRAVADMAGNLDLLRRFADGEWQLVEDPDMEEWRAKKAEGEESAAKFADEKLGGAQEYKEMMGDLPALAGAGMPGAQFGNFMQNAEAPNRDDTIRRHSGYDSLTDEEKAEWRRRRIDAYDRKMAIGSPVATFLKMTGGLDDNAKHLVERAWRTGELTRDDLKGYDETAKRQILGAVDLMRGDQKTGTLLFVPGVDVSENGFKANLYAFQQSILRIPGEVKDAATDIFDYAMARRLSGAEREEAFKKIDEDAAIKAALEQPLAEPESFLGAMVRGVAENIWFLLPVGGEMKGLQMMRAAQGLKPVAEGGKVAGFFSDLGVTLTPWRAGRVAKEAVKQADKAVEAAKGARAAALSRGVKAVGEAKVDFEVSQMAVRKQMAAMKRYTEALRKAEAMRDVAAARVPGQIAKWWGGAAVREASSTAMFSSFFREYVDAADAAGISREDSVPTGLFVGFVNDMVERIYVPGLEGGNLAASEIKYHMVESAAQAVRKMGGEGLKRWAEKSAGRLLGTTAKTVATESGIEEPTQQLMTEFGLALNRRQEQLRKDGQGDVATAIADIWQKATAGGVAQKVFDTYCDAAWESLPGSIGLGILDMPIASGRQRVRNWWNSRDEGLADAMQRGVDAFATTHEYWKRRGDEAASNPNGFLEAITAARKAFRAPQTRDVVKEVADAAGVDVKTAEVLTEYLRIEADMELVSPTFSAWASLNMSLADINEETIKTVLPGYVEGSFAADPEQGVYSGKVRLGDGTERTIAYRVGDWSEIAAAQVEENAKVGSSLGKSFDAQMKAEGRPERWADLSEAERYYAAVRGVKGWSSGTGGVFELTDGKGKKVRVNADDIIYLASGRLADIGYGAAATQGTARHETFHSLWRFVRASMNDEDVQALAKTLGIDVTQDGWEADLDEAMAVQMEQYASGHYVAHAISSRFDKMLDGWAGKIINYFAKFGQKDEVTDPNTGKPYDLKGLYDKVLRGEIGSGALGVELRKVPAQPAASTSSAPKSSMPVEVTDADRAEAEAVEREEAAKEEPPMPAAPTSPAPAVTTSTVPVATSENPATTDTPNQRYYIVKLPNSDSRIVGRLEVRDVDTGVFTSWDEGYHDRDLQNRSVGKKATEQAQKDSEAQLTKISAHPDPLLMAVPVATANDGVPWALPNGDMFIGNHRVQGLRIGYEKGTAGEYEKYVRESAAKSGIEIGADVKRPLMVFVLERIESPDGKTDIYEVVRLANKGNNQDFGKSAEANNDAKILIDNNILPRMKFRADGRIDETRSGDAIGKFIVETGAKEFLNDDGTISEDSERRIVDAALAALLGGTGNGSVLQKIMSNHKKLDMQTELRALMKVTPDLMSLAEAKPAYDLRAPLAEALQLFTEWRDKDETLRSEKDRKKYEWRQMKNGHRVRGLSWEAFMSQGDMFRKPSDEAKILGDLFARAESERSFDREDVESAAGKKRVIDLISGYLADYIANARAVNTETEDMFGGTPASRADVMAAQRVSPAGGKRFSVDPAKVRPATKAEYDKALSTWGEMKIGSENVESAGWIFPDGRVLKPKMQTTPRGTFPHHDSLFAFLERPERRNAVEKFEYGYADSLAGGAMRLNLGNGGIEVMRLPTAAQLDTLYDALDAGYELMEDEGEDTLRVDVDREDGGVVFTAQYRRGTSARRIMDDLRGWFDEKKVPAAAMVSARFSVAVNPHLKEDVEAALVTHSNGGENARPLSRRQDVVMSEDLPLFGAIGLPDMKVVCDPAHLRKINDEHLLTLEQIVELPKRYNDPAVVFKDGDKAFVVVTDMVAPNKAGDEKSVMVRLTEQTKKSGERLFLASAYSREAEKESEYIRLANTPGAAVYCNKDKVAALMLEQGTKSTLQSLASRDDVVTPEGLTANSVSQNGVPAQGGNGGENGAARFSVVSLGGREVAIATDVAAMENINAKDPRSIEKYISAHLEKDIDMLVGGAASITDESARHYAWSRVRELGGRQMRQARAKAVTVIRDLIGMFTADDSTYENKPTKDGVAWRCRLSFGIPKLNQQRKVVGGVVYDADVVIKDDGHGKYFYDVSNLEKNETLTQQLDDQAEALIGAESTALFAGGAGSASGVSTPRSISQTGTPAQGGAGDSARPLAGGGRFSVGGIYTGSAADYANRSRQGGVDDGPSVKKIGSGEGSQVYGWGLYGSTERGVAEGYAHADRDRKRGRRTTLKSDVLYDGKPVRDDDSLRQKYLKVIAELEDYGSVDKVLKNYEFFETHGKLTDNEKENYEWLKANRDRISMREVGDVPQHIYEQTWFTNRAPGDESHLLKWYEPVSEEQFELVENALREVGKTDLLKKIEERHELQRQGLVKTTGQELYSEFAVEDNPGSPQRGFGSPQAASEFLARAGIDGVKYPVDSYGKTVKDGDKAGWNYVAFSDEHIRVDHKWTDGQQRFSIAASATGAEYTYAALTARQDMPIVTVRDDVFPPNARRKEMVKWARDNLLANGGVMTPRGIVVKMDGEDVVVGAEALGHGIRKDEPTLAEMKNPYNALILPNVADILRNAIRVNELDPRAGDPPELEHTFVYLGVAYIGNDLVPVRIQVNQTRGEHHGRVSRIDALHSLNARRQDSNTGFSRPTSPTDTISIANLIGIAQPLHPQIFSRDVAAALGVPYRGGEIGARYSVAAPEELVGAMRRRAEERYAKELPLIAKTKDANPLVTADDFDEKKGGALRFSVSYGKGKQEEMARLIGKYRPDIADPREAVAELMKFETNAECNAAFRWLCANTIKLPQDEQIVKDAVATAARSKVDPAKYSRPGEVLEQFAKYRPKAKAIDPETVPELTDRRDEGSGVVSYQVADTRDGQAAMRRIIDTHWGEDANPWCLLARGRERTEATEDYHAWLSKVYPGQAFVRPQLESLAPLYKQETGKDAFAEASDESRMKDAWEYWNHYNALPKRVAFKNGKLLAFMATEAMDEEQAFDDAAFGGASRLAQMYPEEYREYEKALETDEEVQENQPNFYEWLQHDEYYELTTEEGLREHTPEEWWDRKDESHIGPNALREIAGEPRFSVTLTQQGNFYLAAGKDAEKAAPYLNTRVVERNGKPTTAFPEHMINSMLARLVRNGVGVELHTVDPRTGQMVVRKYDGAPRYSVSIVKPWPKDFPNATLMTTRTALMAKHEDLFRKAKAGDGNAAMELIDALMSDKKRRDKILQLKKDFPDAAVAAAVHAEEESGRNALPRMFAKYIADTLGIKADDTIVQSVRAGHTGADAWYRLTHRAQFDGNVEAGKEYILVDDHITQGGTINELRSFIENNGGKVVAVAALTSSKGSSILSPRKETIDELKARYPDIDQLLRDADIAGSVDAITNSEAEYIKAFSPDTFRNRVAEAKRERSAEDGGRALDDSRFSVAAPRPASAYPQLRGMTDDQLLAAAFAARMALGASEKFSDRAVKVNTVQKKMRQLHPDWDATDIGRETNRILSNARKLGKKLREDIDRGVTESLVLRHLPDTMHEQFGLEMRQEARRGQRLGVFGSRVVGEMERRQERMIADAVRNQTGIDASTIENAFGINLSETMMHLAANPLAEKDETPPPGSGAGQADESTAAPADGSDEEDVSSEKEVDAKVKATVDEIVGKAKAESEADRRNRESLRDAAGRDMERAAEMAGEDTGDEGSGSGDEGGDTLYAAVKKSGLDLESPRHLARFIAELARRQWIKEHGLKQDADVWRDLVAVQFLRKTAESVYAKLCRDLTYSRGRETAMSHIDKFDDIPTVRGLLSEMEFVGAIINARRIRETQKAKCEKLDLFLREKFGAQGRFKPDKEEGKRSVSAEAELRARYMRHAMWLTPDAAAEEARQLQETLDRLSVDFKDAGRDVDQSREFVETVRKLNVLREFGALRYKPIGEIDAAVQWWEDLARGSHDDIMREMLDRDIRTRKAAYRLIVAFANPKRKTAREEKDKKEALNRFITGHMGFISLLQDCMRFASDADAAAAHEVVEYLDLEIQKSGDRTEAEKRRHNDAFHAAVESIYGKKFNEVMAEMQAPDERFMKYMNEDGGVSVQPTKGRAMQLLVSLLQEGRKIQVEDEGNPGKTKTVWEGGYHDNIVKHHREGQAAEIMQLLTSADMNMLKWLGDWYEQNRSELSEICRSLFGIGVYAELPNYFPVKMLLEKQGLEKGQGVSWTIFPKALTPRVKNERDFDTSMDIFSMWTARMEEGAQWKHHALLGLEMRGIFGRAELRKAVRVHHGKAVDDLMQGFITDILAGQGTYDRTPGGVQYFSDKVRGWTALCALGGNVGVMLKQVTSIPALGFEVGLVNTAKHMVTAFTPEGWAAMKRIWNSEQRKTRWRVGSSDAVRAALAGDDVGTFKRLLQLSMITNKIGDAVPALVAQGIYRDFLERGMSDEDAMARTWAIIERTQQSGRMENLVQVQRRNALGRLFYQFLSTQQQYLQKELRAIRDVMARPDSAKRWKALGPVLLLTHFILPSAYYWMGELYKAMLGQEPPEDQLKDWVVSCLLGSFGSLFVAGACCKFTLESVLGKRSFGHSLQIMPMEGFIERNVDSVIRIVMDVGGRDWDKMLEDFDKLMTSDNAVYRDLRKIYRYRIKDEP